MAVRKKAPPGGARKVLDQQSLKRLLHYDPETGIFTRLCIGYGPSDARYVGLPAGGVNSSGYVIVSVFERRHRAHRLAWLYMTGDWPAADIDHRDGDRANNRWANLRSATRSQNIHNMGMRDRNTSGIKGAVWDRARGLWQARITVGGKHRFLGRFDTAEEAGAAYAHAAVQYFGEFARRAA